MKKKTKQLKIPPTLQRTTCPEFKCHCNDVKNTACVWTAAQRDPHHFLRAPLPLIADGCSTSTSQLRDWGRERAWPRPHGFLVAEPEQDKPTPLFHVLARSSHWVTKTTFTMATAPDPSNQLSEAVVTRLESHRLVNSEMKQNQPKDTSLHLRIIFKTSKNYYHFFVSKEENEGISSDGSIGKYALHLRAVPFH